MKSKLLALLLSVILCLNVVAMASCGNIEPDIPTDTSSSNDDTTGAQETSGLENTDSDDTTTEDDGEDTTTEDDGDDTTTEDDEEDTTIEDDGEDTTTEPEETTTEPEETTTEPEETTTEPEETTTEPEETTTEPEETTTEPEETTTEPEETTIESGEMVDEGLLLVFDESTQTYSVTDYTSNAASVIIPDTYEGYPVTSIGPDAFYNCSSLTSITIPDSVTSIGDNAFYGCYRLVEVINHSSLNLTAGSNSSGYVAYYAIEVHNGTSKIVNVNDYLFYTHDNKNYFFCYIGNDTALTLPENYNGENYWIYENAFYMRDELTSVKIPNSVTYIGMNAFRECSSLTSVTIPNSVTKIDYYAFMNCDRLVSVTIGSGVTRIGNYAFDYCYNLVEVVNHSSLNFTVGARTYGDIAHYAKEVHNGTSKIVNLNDYLFYTYNNVNYLLGYIGDATVLTLPENYTGQNYEIYQRAFAFRFDLTSVTIGNGVTSIGSLAFFECNKLVEVINHSSLNLTKRSSSNGYVAYYAKEIHTGTSKIVNVNDYLFYTNNNVNYLLGYVGDDTALTLPENYNGQNYEIYQYAFYNRDDLTSITIPNSVTSIGNFAFLGCSSLTSVTFENKQGWKAGTTAISSTDLESTSTAATYLTSTYYNKNWNRS